jgi:sulfur-oxidizing protein SoxB
VNLSRREFLQLLAAASAAGFALPAFGTTQTADDPYDLPRFGNVSLLHFTDCHAQLLPVHYREPAINLGVGTMRGQPPHLVGNALLKHYGIAPDTRLAHALTHLDFTAAAHHYGKVGGFAHLATLVKRLRAQRPGALLLDGGDTWQGSATALWTQGQDMVDAALLLGVDIMTGHWEFTLGAARVQAIINGPFKNKIDFVAQNVSDAQWDELVFKPYVIRKINTVPVAVIGQAFPYTPIANPAWLIPDWRFGIQEERLQEQVDNARQAGAQVVVVLSHNGVDVDLKLAGRVRGIDAILGGHTHDALLEPVLVNNPAGKTLVINSGSNGKFLSALDLDVRNGRLHDYHYRLLPVFADLLPADAKMAAHIDKVRAPFKAKLGERLAVSEELLYRRGNFNGSFDQLICAALIENKGAEIALSPGFRWGTCVLPGTPITFEDVMAQTAISYPTVTVNTIKGERIKAILEDVADNLFNKDPYHQQGGDMVRTGGLRYSIDPEADMGRRISQLTLNGKELRPNKDYVVAGWASVAEPLEGLPIWELVASYLRAHKTVHLGEPNQPQLINVADNPGYDRSQSMSR